MDLELDRIPLFAGMDRVNLAKLIPALEKVYYYQGDILFRQCDSGDTMFIILSGQVKVFRELITGKTEEIARLGPGECFGEMALLTGERRSAGIEAVEDLMAYRLSRNSFEDLLKKHHSLAVYFSGVLARRLADKNWLQEQCKTETAVAASSGRTIMPYDGSAKTYCDNKASQTKKSLLTKKSVIVAFSVLFLSMSIFWLHSLELGRNHIIIIALLIAATACWVFELVSFHVVSLSLPLLSVLFGATGFQTAFSGFASPSWFLVLGVFAISASVYKTGLLFRFTLLMLKKFPPGYLGQTLGMALTGLMLTPVIPSSNGRAALSSPLALDLIEALQYKNYSKGAIGISMACLLGFGHMSFMFMNGTPTNLLVFGLLPENVAADVTWLSWLLIALPMGLFFFFFSYLTLYLLNKPEEKTSLNKATIEEQLKTLGIWSFKEKVSLWAVSFFILAFLTQTLHQISGAGIALLTFLMLFGAGVLDEKSVRADIDWNFLISFGALVGLGNVMSESGLTEILVQAISPFLPWFTQNSVLFLVSVSLLFYLIRLALPLPPAQLVTMLALMPVVSQTNISPFVVALVILISGNPWFLPHQNTIYLNIYFGTEQRAFKHRQTLKLAFGQFIISILAIIFTVPYWRLIGLIR